MFISPSQSSDPSASIPLVMTTHTQTEDNICPNVYERLFLAMNQPVFIMNLNSTNEKSEPFLLNPAASALIKSSKDDFFQESHLEKFNASLGNFIKSVKGKVAQEVSYTDILRVSVNVNSTPCEMAFALTGTTFELKDATRILGILLMETSRTVEEEIRTVESFKASLASALSHELNNPIHSLILLIKMLPDSDIKEGGDDIKSMALSTACILKNKIRDLIDYVSIETKSMKLEQQEFYVEELFDELNKIFKLEVERKRNALKFDIITYANRRLKILADRNHLEQILTKLIANANKYTDKGTIDIIAKENQSNFDVTFTVKDTGIGIAKDRLELIFAPLNHKHRLSGEYAKLPGLGLEIAKGICQCMDSKLNVKSTVGKGTTFSFEVPTCRLSTFETAEFPINNKKELNSGICIKKMSRTGFIKIESKKEIKLNTRFESYNGDQGISFFGDITGRIGQYNAYIKKSGDSVFHSSKTLVSDFQTKKRVVLVTDDVYSNRLVLCRMLEHLKLQTIEAINGQEAVNAAEKSFDPNSSFEIVLILMDLHMPVMNGIDATIEIRKLEKAYKREKQIPIVAVTAHDGAKDQEGCFNAGMQNYIVKPATHEILKMIVRQYTSNLITVT